MFSIYALLFSSHRVCMLDMHTFFMPCALLIACSDDHLPCYDHCSNFHMSVVFDQVAHMS